MNAAHALRLQQTALQAAITAAEEPRTDALLRSAHGGAPARLSIYRHAYRVRLVAALADNHTVLQRTLGDQAFDALGSAYVDACPSTQASIRWYGHRLAEFMAAREDLVPHPALVDIARMDWALRDAFDAADAAPLDLAALAQWPAECWAGLCFAPHPSLRLLDLGWDIEAAWLADLLAFAADDACSDSVGCCEHATPAHRVSRIATAGAVTRMTMVSRRE